MKSSLTTWRLSFASPPSPQQRRDVRALLEPIARVELPADYGLVLREYGVSDHLFIEPPAERTAGEIALDCLRKAHRLGVGWSVLWPGVPQQAAGGWAAEDWRWAAWPESLDGLHGGLSDGEAPGRSHVAGVQAASFTVTVLADAPPAGPVAQSSAPTPAPLPSPPAGVETEALAPVLARLDQVLAAYETVTWAWDAAGARAQLAQLGYEPDEDAGEENRFRHPATPPARLQVEDGAIHWIHFIVVADPDPHQLDEVAFAARQAEYEALFQAAARHVEQRLGTPVFVGAAGEAGFPAGHWADWAAVWVRAGDRLMVQQKHNDPELPLELCVVFAPPA